MNNVKQDKQAVLRRSTFLLLSFLFIRLFLVRITIEFPHGGLTLDSKDYIDLSESIRSAGIYQDADGDADLRRPPVYPAFLTLFQSTAGLSHPGVTFAQLILVTLTSLIVKWMFDRQGLVSAGLAASWLIAISPNISLWSLTIMSEVLFTFFLVLSLVLISEGLDRSSRVMLIIAGMTLGLATLTRPIGLAVVLLWVSILVVAAMRKWSSAVTLSKILWLAVGSALVILPWMARNAVTHQSFSISDVGTHTLESFNFAIVLSEAEGISRNEATYRLGEFGGTWNQFRWIVAKYPLQFIKSQLAGISRVVWGTEITRWATVTGLNDWNGFGVFRHVRDGEMGAAFNNILETFRTPSELILIVVYFMSVIHTVLLIILSLYSLIKFSNANFRVMILLCSGTALALIFISGAAGQARFRVPVEPFLAVLAGFGWWQIETCRESRQVEDASVL